MNRRKFFDIATLTTAGLIVAPGLVIALQPQLSRKETLPQFREDLVHEFVIAGHNNLDKVKEMLAVNPKLLYASWDWGGGDFETALEGAGHVGNKEIANYLVNMGARPNIFVLTMLGKTEIVKGLLTEFPVLLDSKGPHGFSLMHHAVKGGKDAKPLVEYLESLT